MHPPAERRVSYGRLRSPQGAAMRARTFALLQFSVIAWACIYLALVAVTGHTYIRSIAFGFAAAFSLWLTLGAIFSDAEAIPIPDWYLLAAVLAWAGWSAASWGWSIHPDYTRAEIGTEVGWGLSTAAIFYVAARNGQALRAMVTTAVVIAAVLGIFAIQMVLAHPDIDPEKLLVARHGGVGAFSTYLVMVVPLLPLMLAPRPAGFGTSRIALVATGGLFLLLLVAARITENRMVWVAFAAGFLVAALVAAWRWRGRLARAPKRWGGVLLVLLALVAVLFIDAAMQRARTDRDPQASVAKALADDPRFILWEHTFERIKQRPWTGFGYGKSILREELSAELGNPLLAHAHNIFVSQWLQTGAIGVLTLLALLAALAWRYAAFLRHGDGTLAAIGLVGLVGLAMFVVKSMTDDFLVRPTSKEFWALNGLLVGYGIRRVRSALAR
ncbi:MAG: O-antigen ligase family protein [Burkholderiaceae bacterium]